LQRRFYTVLILNGKDGKLKIISIDISSRDDILSLLTSFVQMVFIFRKYSVEEKLSKGLFICDIPLTLYDHCVCRRKGRREKATSNFSAKIEVEKNVLDDGFLKIKGER